MADATGAGKTRVVAGLAGFGAAALAWPVLAAAVVFLVAIFQRGWPMFGLLVIGAYAWVVLSLASAVIGAFVGGPVHQVVRGVLTVVCVALALYLVFGVVVAFA